MFDLIKFYNLLAMYTGFKLEEESRRSYLGYLWWIIEPLLNVAIYYLLFKVILERGSEDYIQFLFLGIIVWRWLSGAILKSSNSIIAQINLIKKININKILFPLSEVLSVTWKFLVIFIITVCIYSIFYKVTVNYIYLPLAVLSMFALISGTSVFFAAITPLFPDIKLFLPHFFRLLFYPSGILFSVDSLPDKLQFYVGLNPLVGGIQGFRKILIYGDAPEFMNLLLLFSLGLAFFIFGLWILSKNDKKYAKFLI